MKQTLWDKLTEWWWGFKTSFKFSWSLEWWLLFVWDIIVRVAKAVLWWIGMLSIGFALGAGAMAGLVIMGGLLKVAGS